MERRREYKKQYYLKNRIKICKSVINEYCYRCIEKAKENHPNRMRRLYTKYPFETYGENCFKSLRYRFHIRKDSCLFQECYDASMLAYMYSVSRCCINVELEEYIIKYLYKVMKIYFICVLNIDKERKEICKEHHLSWIDQDDYRF